MNSSQARDHLAYVDNILRTADRSLHVSPLIFVVWGLVATIINGVQQARASGVAVPRDSTIQAPMFLLAILVTIWLSLRARGQRETLIDRQAGVVFGVVLLVLAIASFTAQHTVIPSLGIALFWSFGLSMALLIVGIQASRPLLLGGVALIAASVVACFAPGWFSGILALGWMTGMVVPGVNLALRSIDGRAPAV